MIWAARKAVRFRTSCGGLTVFTSTAMISRPASPRSNSMPSRARSRAGWWRIMEVLGQHGAPATVSSSGRAVERLLLLVQDAVRRGHEVSAHGWRWEGHAGLDEAENDV